MPSQSFDALDAAASAEPNTKSLLLCGEAKNKIEAAWHVVLDEGGVSVPMDNPLE